VAGKSTTKVVSVEEITVAEADPNETSTLSVESWGNPFPSKVIVNPP